MRKQNGHLSITDDLIPLTDVPKRLEKILGRQVHMVTVYRWRGRGDLQVIRIAGKEFTTIEALDEMFRIQTERHNASNPKRTPTKRTAAIKKQTAAKKKSAKKAKRKRARA